MSVLHLFDIVVRAHSAAPYPQQLVIRALGKNPYNYKMNPLTLWLGKSLIPSPRRYCTSLTSRFDRDLEPMLQSARHRLHCTFLEHER